jgi:hypothetical protein
VIVGDGEFVASCSGIALYPIAGPRTLQMPAHFGSNALGLVATTFVASTRRMRVAAAWEVVRRTFSPHFGDGD